MTRVLMILAAVLCLCAPAFGQELRALARLLPEASGVEDTRDGVAVTLAITQAVPYRVVTLDAPKRVAIDFREVAFEATAKDILRSEKVTDLRTGRIAPGWSRLVLDLAAPMKVDLAGMVTDPAEGDAVIQVTLSEATVEEFAAAVALSSDDLVALAASETPPASDKPRPVIVLDPGHGGVDPGAERDGIKEADLMLIFARELREILVRSGRYDVVLTREEDVFVSLPARVSIARAVEGDLFLSLHADALAEGRATGTTIYTLSDRASDKASAALAERQDRQDILAGVDLRAQDDEIATVLMDLARARTHPRSDAVADFLVEGLRDSLGKLHKRPRLTAGFSVLKAPDIPSVLIELGFMSSKADLDNLMNPDWRVKAAQGVLKAVDAWHLDELARREAGQ